jgi:hypothetical protein
MKRLIVLNNLSYPGDQPDPDRPDAALRRARNSTHLTGLAWIKFHATTHHLVRFLPKA